MTVNASLLTHERIIKNVNYPDWFMASIKVDWRRISYALKIKNLSKREFNILLMEYSIIIYL
jgi:hypothetical protein